MKKNIPILSNMPDNDEENSNSSPRSAKKSLTPKKKGNVNILSQKTPASPKEKVVSVISGTSSKRLGRPRSDKYQVVYPSKEFTIPDLLRSDNNYTMLYQRVQVDVKRGVLEEVRREKNSKGKGAHVRVFKVKEN